MKKLRWQILAALFGIVLVAGGLSPLYAQETTDDEEFTLEEITVTAQKRKENQQKVAITMDVISAEDIKTLGKNNLDEILTGSSSAIIQKAADGYRVSIRGISDDEAVNYGQSMSTPAVAINTDGVYSNRKDTGSSLFDVERVEVLYGPQSTMYASNSPGGIVNVVTASPKLENFSVDASLEMGNYNLVHTEGAVNVPVADTIALRASFSTSKHDGYLEGGSDDEDTKSARLRALFEPGDRLSLILTGEYSKDKGAGFGSGVESFGDQDEVDNPWTALEDDSLSENDQDGYKVFLNMDLDIGFASLSFVPSYSEKTGDNIMNFMGEYRYNDTSIKEKSAELRMASSADFFFKWIVGVTYLDSENVNNQVNDAYLAGYTTDEGAEYSFRTNNETAKAVFANVTYPVTDTMRLTAGIRKSWDDMETDNDEYKQGETFDQETKQPAPSRPDIKVGFEYDLGTSSMLYGDYSTSYRVQGMTSSTDPQELKAYSLGAKNRFLDNRLQLNAGAYYYDYENYSPSWREQVWILDLNETGGLPGDGILNTGGGGPGGPPPGGPGGGASLSETTEDTGSRDVVGQGHMWGIDLSINALITSRDLLNLTVSWSDSEWTDLYFDWEYDQQLNTFYDEHGNPYADWVAHPDKDYSGKPMTNTPPWTINLNYTHTFTLWNGGTLKPGVNVKYQTGYYLSWEEDYYPDNWQETHYMMNANMAYAAPSGHWSLSAYVNNIAEYAEKRQYMNVGGMGRLSIGDPRTYGATLSVKF